MLKHPQLQAVRFTTHNEHETLYWLKAAVILGLKTDWFYGKKKPFPKYYAKNAIRQLLRGNGIKPGKLNTRDDIYRSWIQLEEKCGPHFLEKSPHHLNHFASTRLITEYILNAGDNSKVIGLIRHPGAVVYSTLQRWYVNPAARIDKWCYTYDNLKYLQAQLPESRFSLVRYEDMIENTEATFRRLCDFIQLPYDRKMGADIHARSADKWKEDASFSIPLSEKAIRLMKHFGYPLEKADTKTKVQFDSEKFSAMRFRLKSSMRRIWVQYIDPLIPF